MAIGEFLRQRRKDRVERSASAGGWKGDGVAKLVGMLFGPVREAGRSRVESIFSRPVRLGREPWPTRRLSCRRSRAVASMTRRLPAAVSRRSSIDRVGSLCSSSIRDTVDVGSASLGCQRATRRTGPGPSLPTAELRQRSSSGVALCADVVSFGDRVNYTESESSARWREPFLVPSSSTVACGRRGCRSQPRRTRAHVNRPGFHAGSLV